MSKHYIYIVFYRRGAINQIDAVFRRYDFAKNYAEEKEKTKEEKDGYIWYYVERYEIEDE